MGDPTCLLKNTISGAVEPLDSSTGATRAAVAAVATLAGFVAGIARPRKLPDFTCFATQLGIATVPVLAAVALTPPCDKVVAATREEEEARRPQRSRTPGVQDADLIQWRSDAELAVAERHVLQLPTSQPTLTSLNTHHASLALY